MPFGSQKNRSKVLLGILLCPLLLGSLLTACSVDPSPASNSPPAAKPPTASIGLPLLPSLAPVLSKVSPAVVNIATQSNLPGNLAGSPNPLLDDPFFRRFFDLPEHRAPERTIEGLGSGVIINANQGYILTSQHVIDQADQITVTLSDGRQLRAEVIAADSTNDLALLRVAVTNLQAITLAADDRLAVGDFVIAIGNPFGLGRTATAGIVSALGRSGPADRRDFIQTDASINPGNSGGPLVNLNGKLVGINSAILAPNGSSVGIGFAIPVSRIRRWLALRLGYSAGASARPNTAS